MKSIFLPFFYLHPQLTTIGIRQAEKEEAAADKEDGKKRKGGVQVPDEWPWEEAKKIFAEPDVTPADQIQVRNRSACVRANNSGLMDPAARMGDSKRRRTRRLSGEGEGIQVEHPLSDDSNFC